jgi:hypothetical protein
MAAQKYEILSSTASGDNVIVEVQWTGTLRIPLGSLPEGGQMKARSAMFLTFRNGRIVRRGITTASIPGKYGFLYLFFETETETETEIAQPAAAFTARTLRGWVYGLGLGLGLGLEETVKKSLFAVTREFSFQALAVSRFFGPGPGSRRPSRTIKHPNNSSPIKTTAQPNVILPVPPQRVNSRTLIVKNREFCLN